MITNEGFDALIDAIFQGTFPGVDPWYVGLIADKNFTGTSPSDTMGSHAGWEEWDGYAGNRATLGASVTSLKDVIGGGTASAPYIEIDQLKSDPWIDQNGDQASNFSNAPFFNIIRSGRVRGFFVTSTETKGNNTGTLLGAFAVPYFSNASTVINTSVIVESGDKFGIGSFIYFDGDENEWA